jgi:hypothetical protein
MIEWVATKPEFRRRGLVNRLLLEALEIGNALFPLLPPRLSFGTHALLFVSSPAPRRQAEWVHSGTDIGGG